MISSNFKRIFNIQVLHSYFQDGVCKYLRYTPQPFTQEVMNRYGFVVHMTNSGFDFYADTATAKSDLFDYITTKTGHISFDFSVVTTNPNFYNVTNLPLYKETQLQYDSRDIFKNSSTTNTAGAVLKPRFSDKDRPSKLASIQIYFDDVSRPLKDGNDVSFIIQFEARSTQWQYYIINKSGIDFNDLQVVGKSDIQFTGPSEVRIPNNEKAILFVSDIFIPLRETPENKFDLVRASKASANDKNRSKSTQKIFSGLPNPDPGNIEIIHNADEKEIASPMFIYV